MKFSTKVRYGMRAVIEIAQSSEECKILNISRIAASQDLSIKYLESLLVQLRNEGILNSSRGKNGGYSLKRNPNEITVYNIVKAFEGPLELVTCSPLGESCNRVKICKTIDLWSHLSEVLKNEMMKITLKDLIENKKLSEVLV